MTDQKIAATCLMLCLAAAAACAEDNDRDTDDDKPTMSRRNSMTKPDPEPSQQPPQGADKIEAWLAAGDYKQWACEDDVHESRDPSPHGYNRICSNDVIARQASGSDDWPVGAAAVKELYGAADSDEIVGFAVYLKTKSDSAGGKNWYWYERVPLDSEVPHDDRGVVADGFGDDGPEKMICVSCHAAAGADDKHTPSAGGRDQVYTPVD